MSHLLRRKSLAKQIMFVCFFMCTYYKSAGQYSAFPQKLGLFCIQPGCCWTVFFYFQWLFMGSDITEYYSVCAWVWLWEWDCGLNSVHKLHFAGNYAEWSVLCLGSRTLSVCQDFFIFFILHHQKIWRPIWTKLATPTTMGQRSASLFFLYFLSSFPFSFFSIFRWIMHVFLPS